MDAGRGLHRRGFLLSGVLSGLGLNLPAYLRAQSRDARAPARSAIFIWLGGGLSHHDTFDPKPAAAAEVRGEYGAIATATPGVRFAESVPLLAQQMPRLAVLRTVSHTQGAHEPGQAYMISGYSFRAGHNFPSIGSVVSYLSQDRSRENGLPPYIAAPDETVRGGGHLGPAFNPFSVPADPALADFRVQDVARADGVTQARFQSRQELLAQVNEDFRATRTAPVRQAVDRYTEQAYRLMTAAGARDAFDLDREHPRVRDRYGRTAFGQRLLLARRLVEAGVPFVTVGGYEWDDHRNIFPALRQKLPAVDRGLSALVADLAQRGMLDETLIVMTGEFGRTPRINNMAGRDHWPQTFSVVLAGGGVRGGLVLGTSDDEGAFPKERPVCWVLTPTATWPPRPAARYRSCAKAVSSPS
jgi:hypothetical protein